MDLQKLMENKDLSPEIKAQIKEAFDAAVDAKVAEKMAKEEDEEVVKEEEKEEMVAEEGEKFSGDLSDEEIEKIVEMIPQSVITDFRSEADTGKPINKQSLKMSLERMKTRLGDNPLFKPALALFQYLADILESPAGASIVRRLTDPVPAEGSTEEVPEADAQMEEMMNEMVQNVDRYLSYAADSFVKENALAIESGLKTELVESFMAGLKTLFLEHNVEVPEDSISIVEKLNKSIDELQNKLNESYEEKIQLKEAVETEKKRVLAEQVENAFLKNTSTIAVTSAEKLRKLMENVEYKDVEDYVKKLEVMKESVEKKPVISEEKKVTEPVVSEVVGDERVLQLLNAMKRNK